MGACAKVLRPGNMRPSQSAWEKALRGHCTELGQWSLNCNGALRMSETSGPWGGHWRSWLAAQKRSHVLDTKELEGWDAARPLESRWFHHRPQRMNEQLKALRLPHWGLVVKRLPWVSEETVNFGLYNRLCLILWRLEWVYFSLWYMQEPKEAWGMWECGGWNGKCSPCCLITWSPLLDLS